MSRKRKLDEPEELCVLPTRACDFFYTRDEGGSIHKVRWLLDLDHADPVTPTGILGLAERDGTLCRLHLCANNPCRREWARSRPVKDLPWDWYKHERFVSFVPQVYD